MLQVACSTLLGLVVHLLRLVVHLLQPSMLQVACAAAAAAFCCCCCDGAKTISSPWRK